jgi:hypothetical protein
VVGLGRRGVVGVPAHAAIADVLQPTHARGLQFFVYTLHGPGLSVRGDEATTILGEAVSRVFSSFAALRRWSNARVSTGAIQFGPAFGRSAQPSDRAALARTAP